MSSNPRDRALALDDKGERYWKPNAGDVLSGVVIDIDFRTSVQTGDEVPVLLVETADGEIVTAWAYWSSLEREIRKANVQIGDEIAIRRLQDAESGKPGRNPPRRYRIFTNRQSERRVDWSSVRSSDDDAGPAAPARETDPGAEARRRLREEADKAEPQQFYATGTDDARPRPTDKPKPPFGEPKPPAPEPPRELEARDNPNPSDPGEGDDDVTLPF